MCIWFLQLDWCAKQISNRLCYYFKKEKKKNKKNLFICIYLMDCRLDYNHCTSCCQDHCYIHSRFRSQYHSLYHSLYQYCMPIVFLFSSGPPPQQKQRSTQLRLSPDYLYIKNWKVKFYCNFAVRFVCAFSKPHHYLQNFPN